MPEINREVPPPSTYENANLINDYRILMSRVTYLVRFYIVENITGIGNPEITYKEILRLPAEENQLISYFPEFADETTEVIVAYLIELKNLMDAMISKDKGKADASIQKLYETSDMHAQHLAGLSPYWDESTWKDLFYKYNRDLIAEAFAILIGDYSQALDIFEGFMEKGLMIGDYYAEGLSHLLPEDQHLMPAAYSNMIKDFRKAGTEWAYLTRFYIVTRIVGLGNDKDVTRKFYGLALRIKEKTELILGSEIADEMSNAILLYIVKLEGLIDAILSGDQAAIDIKTEEAYQYSNQLSALFSSSNPYWDEAKWKELFGNFAELIITQSLNIHRKEYFEAMKNFERLLYASLAINDYYAYGLYQYAMLA
ncbi:hypothetical protein MASR2M70_21860 [Bacillota bacterium]